MEASLAPDGQCERTGNIRLGHPLPFTLFTPRDDISEGLFFCSLVQYNSLYDTAFVFCKLETRNVRMLGNKGGVWRMKSGVSAGGKILL